MSRRQSVADDVLTCCSNPLRVGRAGYIYLKICHFRADFPVWNLQVRNTNRKSCHVLREAYGVRPAGRRFRPSGTAPKREQAPRTPNASRGSATVGLLNDVAPWPLWFRLRRPGDSAPYLLDLAYFGQHTGDEARTLRLSRRRREGMFNRRQLS